MQLNLRTFASSGLIYYMTHQKQVDYAALQLQGGKLYFSFDLGKGRAVAFHGAIVSDGKWHTVGGPNACIQPCLRSGSPAFLTYFLMLEKQFPIKYSLLALFQSFSLSACWYFKNKNKFSLNAW